MAVIKLNRTKTGVVPTSLADGELYIDQLNGKLYWADATGVIKNCSILGLASYATTAGSATIATIATNAGNADTVDGYHAGVAANQLVPLNAAAKVPVSADKVIISTGDPVAEQGDQNWLWFKV